MDTKSFSANALKGLEYYAKETLWAKVEMKIIAYLEGVGLDWYAQKVKDELSDADSSEIENIKGELIADPKLLIAVKAAIATAKSAG